MKDHYIRLFNNGITFYQELTFRKDEMPENYSGYQYRVFYRNIYVCIDTSFFANEKDFLSMIEFWNTPIYNTPNSYRYEVI